MLPIEHEVSSSIGEEIYIMSTLCNTRLTDYLDIISVGIFNPYGSTIMLASYILIEQLFDTSQPIKILESMTPLSMTPV
jgi:hypothetical protein